MYFVTSIWRGSLHISPMRLFATEEEAISYAKSLTDEARIYKLSSDAEPIKIKF